MQYNNMQTKLIEIANEVEKKFNEYFDIFSEFNIEGSPYIIGGFLRSILLDRPTKDLDIIVCNGNKKNILENIRKNNLEYKTNHFNGYKILYNGKEIDIWNVNNLIDGIEYNIEALFYDIKEKEFIDLGFVDSIENNKLIEINEKNRSDQYLQRREKICKEWNTLKRFLLKDIYIQDDLER